MRSRTKEPSLCPAGPGACDDGWLTIGIIIHFVLTSRFLFAIMVLSMNIDRNDHKSKDHGGDRGLSLWLPGIPLFSAEPLANEVRNYTSNYGE